MSNSNPQQRDHLARIRDNQRRSRARRREYVQDLEQRLRVCELQGVEASAEVQTAARRVIEENMQLRELLRHHGCGDDYINHFLRTGNMGAHEQRQASLSASGPSMAVQDLNQAMATRHPPEFEPVLSHPMIVSPSRPEDSAALTVTTTSASSWEPTPAVGSYSLHQPMTATLATGSREPTRFSAPAYIHAPSAPRADLFQILPQTSLAGDISQSMATTQSMRMDERNYGISTTEPYPSTSLPGYSTSSFF